MRHALAETVFFGIAQPSGDQSRSPRCENARRKRGTGASPARLPNALAIEGPPQEWIPSMPRLSRADAVKALLYCGEAFVDQRLELVVGEDVGPILLNPLPN